MFRVAEIIDALTQSHWRNWWDWDCKKCKEYVLDNFDCSEFVARKVAKIIKDWR